MAAMGPNLPVPRRGQEGPESAHKRQPSDHNPLDLIEAELVAPAIVELRGARRGAVRHRRSFLQRAAILEVRSDPGRSEAVVPSLVAMPPAAARRRIIA